MPQPQFDAPNAVKGHWRMIYIVAWSNARTGRVIGRSAVVPDRYTDHWCGQMVQCYLGDGAVYIRHVGT